MIMLALLVSTATTSLLLARRTALAAGAASAAAAVGTRAAEAADATPRRVLVAGATGRTGRRVLDVLAATPGAEAIAGVRSAASADKLPAGVGRLVCDLTAEECSLAALTKELLTLQCSDVICTIGFAPTFLPEQDRAGMRAVDYLATLRLIEAAEAAKLRGRFVLVSSLGIDAGTSSARMLDESLGGVLQQKRQAEAALREKAGLDWTIVRPGLLQKDKAQGGVLLGPAGRWVGDAQADRVAGLDAPVKCASPFLASSGAVCAATRLQVAEVCVAALDGDEAWSRRIVEVVARPEVPEGTMRTV